jgi:ketosteroid isomerase-like protein
MSAADNRKLITDAFAAWARGDGNAFFNLLAEDVRWTVIGGTPVSRTYPGRAAFVEGAVKPLTAKLAGPIVPTVRDIIAEGDKLVLQWDGRSSGKNGAIYHQTYCWVMRFENGKVREGVAYLDTALIDQLWA